MKTPSNPKELKGAPRRKFENWNAYCLDTWILETIAVVFSVGCLIAMCAILLAYDDKPRPAFSFGLSLNAIISLLATGSKSSLMFVVGEALSQNKWVWLQSSAQPLLDVQAFDSASRGPLGSMMMLFQGKRSLATLGAAVTVAFLAFDPFVQQITEYPTRSAPITDGSGIAVTKSLDQFTPSVLQSEWGVAYLTGVWSDDNLYQPQCSSGNCTWPVFRSVGVCSKCADITRSSKLHCNVTDDLRLLNGTLNGVCQITPPLGVSKNVTVSLQLPSSTGPDFDAQLSFGNNVTWAAYEEAKYEVMNLSGSHTDTFTSAGVTSPLLVYDFAQLEYDFEFLQSSKPVDGFRLKEITECSLAICLSDWKVSVTKGNVLQELSNIDYGELVWKNTSTNAAAVELSLCWRPSYAPANISFFADGSSKMGPTDTDEYAFCGITSALITSPRMFDVADIKGYIWKHGKRSTIYNTEDSNDEESSGPSSRVASEGLEYIMSNVANSLTKVALSKSGRVENGTAHDIEVYVVIQWPWLILPALSVLSGVSFFILAVLFNRSATLWKSSILAFLYHGPSDIGMVDDCNAVSGMEERSAGMKVQLLKDMDNNSKLRRISKGLEFGDV